jgi:hypothetical protein
MMREAHCKIFLNNASANLMPLLAKELNYTYTANHVILA